MLQGGFQVTALTRQGSTHNLPPSVRVAPVDYDSLESLTEALRGHDAVVSTIASAALAKQLLLVEAAAAAQVKRFIPSEFGSNTVNEKSAKLPSYGDKVAVQNALRKHAADGTLSYTTVINGPFLDWGITVGFIMNLKAKSINLWDGGHRVFSTTTLNTIGKAVAGVLSHPDETKNRPVFVQDTAVSQRDLLEKGKVATGAPETWTENTPSVDELVAQGWAELGKEHPNPDKFVMNFISAAIWGEGYGAHFEKLDNELLGIRQLTGDELQALINGLAK